MPICQNRHTFGKRFHTMPLMDWLIDWWSRIFVFWLNIWWIFGVVCMYDMYLGPASPPYGLSHPNVMSVCPWPWWLKSVQCAAANVQCHLLCCFPVSTQLQRHKVKTAFRWGVLPVPPPHPASSMALVPMVRVTHYCGSKRQKLKMWLLWLKVKAVLVWCLGLQPISGKHIRCLFIGESWTQVWRWKSVQPFSCTSLSSSLSRETFC